MTRREKVLAMCVGGTLGGLALVMLVRWAILEPFESVRNDIAQEQRRNQKLRARLDALDRIEQLWQEQTRRTLAADPAQAEIRFRTAMDVLFTRHGLRVRSVRPGTPVRSKKDGPIGVPLSFSVSGTLNQLVGFLCDFYRQDFAARLDKLFISSGQGLIMSVNNPKGRPPSGRAGRPSPAGGAARAEAGPHGPELSVDISAITLVLPKMSDIPHEIPDEIAELTDGRVLRSRGDYNRIFEHSLFVPFQEKPATVVASQPAPTTQPTAKAPPPPPPPPVNPRPDAEHLYLVATTQLRGERVAYVVDDRQRDKPAQEYRLDEAIDDGTLVLIHPKGIVVRVGPPGQPKKDYFYPLRKVSPALSFKEREELNPIDHPEVWDALQREFVPLDATAGGGTLEAASVSSEGQGS